MSQSTTLSVYGNGKPYSLARGRYAPKNRVVDQLPSDLSVVQGCPTADDFVRQISREMKIRFYGAKTIKAYRNALGSFLRWFGRRPHVVTREDVRCYLELLCDGGASSSWVSINLSAIRTAFDKMCCRQVTLGLQTPRRPKRVPVVLSQNEVMRMLSAAPSLRDKLLIGLLYALGVRVGEVVRLRWRDFDLDRATVNIWQGKGRTDRQVMLPDSFRPLLQRIASENAPSEYVFPSEYGRYSGRQLAQRKTSRHLSPRTVLRVVKNVARIAGVSKDPTPHSFRHSFATHLLESGTDIRFIQKLLGHVRLETTTIYTKVAVIRSQRVTSPIDAIAKRNTPSSPNPPSQPVGYLQIELVPRQSTGSPVADVRLRIRNQKDLVEFGGIVVREGRPGWITLDLPPQEDWTAQSQRLSPEQRERMDTAQFYETLRNHITNRFLALPGRS